MKYVTFQFNGKTFQTATEASRSSELSGLGSEPGGTPFETCFMELEALSQDLRLKETLEYELPNVWTSVVWQGDSPGHRAL